MTPEIRDLAAMESYPTFWDDALRAQPANAAGGETNHSVLAAPVLDDQPDDATDEHVPLDRG